MKGATTAEIDSWGDRMGVDKGSKGGEGEPDGVLSKDTLAFYVSHMLCAVLNMPCCVLCMLCAASLCWSLAGTSVVTMPHVMYPVSCAVSPLPLLHTDKPVLVPGWHRPPSTTKVRGFGLEGDPPAEEVLLLLAGRERPSSPDHLLAGNRVAALVALAALSESLDYIADRMVSQQAGRVKEGLGAPC
jgi:hypothetical protein